MLVTVVYISVILRVFYFEDVDDLKVNFFKYNDVD